MEKKYSLLLIAFLCFIGMGFGQITLYTENMYNGTGGASGNSIAIHESNDRFNEDGLTYSGTGDMRTSFASSGYTTATGTWNVMLNAINETFIADNLNLLSYPLTTISFGLRKSTSAENGSGLILEYSTSGITGPFTTIVWGSLPTGTGTSTWYYISGITIPNNTTTIRFRSTNSVEWRIDDVLIQGSSTDEVDWCNLQFPESGSINTGNTYSVYTRVYESGSTNVTFGDVGPNLEAWIGYSTSNTNPNTWTNWVPATFNGDYGNDDEYVAEIGSVLPSGNYYYASRFRLNGGPYKYGGYNAGGGGFWDGITNTSGVLSIDTVDFCNLQSPNIATIELCDNFEVYGQVFEFGVTDTANNQGTGITAEVGYSTSNTHPNTWTNWIPTAYNATCTGGNFCNSNQNDEYYGNLGGAITAPGTYYYAMRYTLNSGAYSYGGILADGTAGNFWDGTTYISGVLTVNAPEIDVERNTGASIASGTCSPNTGNNTLFAATSVGSTTASKVYYIHNEGGADLIVTSITLNSGLDFNILNAPSLPVTISPGDSVSFEIEFAPSTVGNNLVDTIIIASNDCDESTYTFCVGGTGLCAASSISVSPSLGPFGTVVTVNGTNLSTATASFNSISATVNHISSTEMEVTVPTGSSTGNLEVTDGNGCSGSIAFTVIDNVIGGCEGSSLLSELFISEVTDATYGSLTYIEIYNATGSTVDLTNYSIRIYANGSTTSYTEQSLSGYSVANEGTFILTTGTYGFLGDYLCSVDGGDGLYGDLASNNLSGVNIGSGNDDFIGLYLGGNLVDAFGVFGDDSWTSTTILTGNRGFDFRRLNTATPLPSTVFSTGDWNIIDWAGSGSGSCNVNDYSNIGSYDFSTGVPPSITVQPSAPSSSCDLSASISVTAIEGFVGGDPLAYQWYYSAPGDSGWTTVTNSAVYSGATSATLDISNTLGLDNYQYYCEVREDNATCYRASNAVQLTVQATTWNGSAWSNGVPNINTVAIIDGNYSTSIGGVQDSFSACNLIVNSGTLTIADNDYVEVENHLIVNSNIIVNPYGSFVQNSNSGSVTVANYNSITVEKLTAVANQWYEYTYWGSPVENETIGNGLAEGTPSRRFAFNAANYKDSLAEIGNSGMYNSGQDDIDDDGNDWYFVSASTPMEAGVGYASTLNSTIFNSTPGCNSPSGCQIKYTFNGAFNNGIITVPVYRNDSELNDNNWNLLGNPYPSAIDADSFLAVNSLLDTNVSETSTGVTDGAIFFWSQKTPPSNSNSGNQQINFPQSDYAIINGTGQTAGGDGVIPNRYIPSGQGFFVSYSNSGASVSVNGNIVTGEVIFNNAMRSTGNNNQFFRTTPNSNNKLWLNLTSNNGVFNQILVGYLEGATSGYDGMYFDAPRNMSTELISMLYTRIDGKNSKFAIQARASSDLNLDEEIPLGFSTSISAATIYTLSIAQLEGDFMTTNTIYLKDNYLNLYHDLNISDYNFTSNPGEFDNRFEIVFQDNSLSTTDSILSPNDLTIIDQLDGSVKFKVGGNYTISQIEIIDLLGRTLYQLEGSSQEEVYFLPQLNQSAYIAEVTLDNGQTLVKKAIKK